MVSVEEAIEAFRNGEMLILIDDEEREDEGDLVLAAEHVTPEKINFMITHGKGLVCVALTEERAQELKLRPMVARNTALLNTAFTESVDVIHGVTTGISAYDRAETVKALVDSNTRPEDLARPGHVFPLIAHPGGVIMRPGHTEAVVDLARIAGIAPAGVLCEIVDENGTMAKLPSLLKLAEEFNLKVATVADIIRFRCQKETLIEKVTDVQLPTAYGDFQLYLFQNRFNSQEHHLALVKGDLRGEEPVLIRVHSECLTGDTFGSLRCDCGDQLHHALQQINKVGRGAVLYLKQEGRGIGLANKILAYKLQDEGKDTVEANEALGFKADLREYWFAAQMLKELGVQQVRLMTNNPRKVNDLEKYGIEVVERVPIIIHPNPNNKHYLLTKGLKLGHFIEKSMLENGKDQQ
ncbi:MAG: bifunctional 3,4-dihydroxy-2-butanone-4-phosphate synthase/GTP cyclohydrolase II [Calditrichaeota bacterium]|nr:MAG: bifunctional 3,4-dihydroxy-2-butanone-4-phosphate synthase/GTP cyclohydrolase II [Calditrichota bacterium]